MPYSNHSQTAPRATKLQGTKNTYAIRALTSSSLLLLLPPFLANFCQYSTIFFIVTALGYFAAAGSLYWLLFVRRSAQVTSQQKNRPENIKDTWALIRSDVMLSVLSSGIFAVCAAVMTVAYQFGYTKIYLQPQQYGYGYLAFSLILVIVLQDTYFYFTHRLSHHPKCYRWLHSGHHHSKNPTPWTAFAFDPAEAMIQAIYLIGVTLLIPIHLSVLTAVVIVMTMGALIHHFGVRLFEETPFGNWLGSWMVGCTHHWLHHRKYTVHYSLYFTFWDKLLKTQYEGYESVLTPPVETPVELSVLEGSKQENKTVRFPTAFDKAS